MTKEHTFTYQTRLVLNESSFSILKSCANLYSSIQRHLFHDLQKNTDLNSLKREYITRFEITARQFNAIRVSLDGKIASIKEKRQENIAELKAKITSLQKKIPKIKNKLIRHHKTRRLLSLERKLEVLQKEHKEEKTSLCFGSKKLFHAQFHLAENGYSSFQEWKEEWVSARNSEFFCLGSKDETSGNQTCSLLLSKDKKISLRLRLPNAQVKEHGKYVLFEDVYFAYGQKELIEAFAAGKALSYRFKLDEKGWRVFVSFSREEAPVITKEAFGAIGLDINADHLAVTEIDSNGNPIDKKTFSLCTYGKSKDQAKALIGDICKEVVLLAKSKQKPLIVEELTFQKKKAQLKEESSKKLARMLSSLSYRQILSTLERQSAQKGVAFHFVSPTFTSIIGQLKFAKRYGLSKHHAAALCIARRFFTFSEAPSKCPIRVVHKNVQVTFPQPARIRGKHVWVFWKEAAKKCKAALAAHFRKSSGPQYCRSG